MLVFIDFLEFCKKSFPNMMRFLIDQHHQALKLILLFVLFEFSSRLVPDDQRLDNLLANSRELPIIDQPRLLTIGPIQQILLLLCGQLQPHIPQHLCKLLEGDHPHALLIDHNKLLPHGLPPILLQLLPLHNLNSPLLIGQQLRRYIHILRLFLFDSFIEYAVLSGVLNPSQLVLAAQIEDVLAGQLLFK